MDIKWKSRKHNFSLKSETGFFREIWKGILSSRNLILGMLFLFFVSDIILLKWVIPNFYGEATDWWLTLIFMACAFMVWYDWLTWYTKKKIGEIDILNYPENFMKWKSIWKKSLPPLIIFEIYLWIMMLSPVRPYDVVYYYNGIDAVRVFDFIGGSYLAALASYDMLWLLSFVAGGPCILWWISFRNIQNKYSRPLFEKIYRLYENLGAIYPDEILKPFFYGTEEGDVLTKEWNVQKSLMNHAIEEAARERLRSEKLKMELITNVSHDLKTPLTAIFNYLELMRREESLEDMQAYTEDVSLLCEKLKSMIERLFALSKASSGNENLDIQTIEMNCLVRQTCSDMDEILEHAPAAVRFQLEESSLFFSADNRYAYSICQNLLENAAKYSLAGSRVYVRTRKTEDGYIQLEVVNTSAYEMNFAPDQITERFVRGDKSRTTEGNGLGLAIVKAYTEACGGSFQIQIDGDQFKAAVTFPETAERFENLEEGNSEQEKSEES